MKNNYQLLQNEEFTKVTVKNKYYICNGIIPHSISDIHEIDLSIILRFWKRITWDFVLLKKKKSTSILMCKYMPTLFTKNCKLTLRDVYCSILIKQK